MSGFAEFEWAIMLGIALGLGLWEMWRIRRLIRQDRVKALEGERGTRNGSIS